MTRLLTLSFIFFSIATTCLAVSKKQPNIIFILADDMSFDSVSANNDKIGNMKTPHIDHLIKNGMNFTDAHSGSAVCTPTRYGLLTGRYAWRTELKNSVLWDYAKPLIDEKTLTVPALLKEQGYSTGMVGKWHLGMTWRDKDGNAANQELKISDASFRKDDGPARIRDAEQKIDWSKKIDGPLERGFDYYFGVDVPNFPPYSWIDNGYLTKTPTIPKPKSMFGHHGLMAEGWQLEDILPGLQKSACQWIRKESKTDKPFFLYFSLTSPHTPISPSKEWQGKSGISKYADFVMETDWVVGQITKTLEETGQLDNTLIIFSTDNGTSGKANFKELEKHGVDLHNHFKGHKAQIYEGGHRVPFVAHWPGKIKENSTCAQTICLNDFMATCAELTKRDLKDNEGVDSSSFLSLLTGEKATLSDRPFVVHHDYGGQYALRNGKWKCIFPKRPSSVKQYKLYDLEQDPKETINLAEKMPAKVKELEAILKKYITEGRSTPGTKQTNWKQATTWNGLPWNAKK